MYNQRHLTLKTPNKLSNRPDWDYLSYEKKNKNGGSSGLAEGNSFSTMLSGAKSDAHKGALIKNNAIGLVSEKVGEQKAQRLFSGLNNEEVAKSYSALEESYKIGKRQGSYIPPTEWIIRTIFLLWQLPRSQESKIIKKPKSFLCR